MGSPFEVYFTFHVFLLMSVTAVICLTIKCTKSPNRKKNCIKSHSRRLCVNVSVNGQNPGGQNPGGQDPGENGVLGQNPRVDFQGGGQNPREIKKLF